MRKNKAIYGGEISAHHYFRDFAYCDSGMIPWLIVWQLLSERNSTLYDLISERKTLFPSSGELNFTITDAASCLKRLKEKLAFDAKLVEELDGLSMSFVDWRFNLRPSNTEPLIRLNIETRGDQSLLNQKIRELKDFINQDSI